MACSVGALRPGQLSAAQVGRTPLPVDRHPRVDAAALLAERAAAALVPVAIVMARVCGTEAEPVSAWWRARLAVR